MKYPLKQCPCSHCQRSRRLSGICKNLSEDDAAFLTEMFEQLCTESEDRCFIEAGLSGSFFRRQDLKQVLGLSDEKLNQIVEKNRNYKAGDTDGKKGQVEPGSGTRGTNP